MAVRIRSDHKTIVCAAKSEEELGDVYIGDGLHYVLGVELCVLSVCGRDNNDADLWEFHAPITLKEKIAKEEKVMEDLAYINSISPNEMTDQEFLEWLDPTEARHNRYLEIVFNDSDDS